MSDLWRDGRMTLEFWAWGSGYTIVKNRHIGLDQAPDPGGEPWDVPALVAGTVVRSVQTDAIGRVVVVDTGRPTRRYISYCHGFYGDPAGRGDALAQGGRVMRLAQAWEQPGSLWQGVHCHVVVHDNPGGAYLTGLGDTYYDPAVEIAAYNSQAAADGSRPFNPGGFLMALTDAEQNEMLTLLRGMLSSQDQVTLFQNVQAVRDRTEGNLSSQHQVEVYQTGNTIRDRVDAILAILGKTPPSGAPFDVEGVAAALREGLGEDLVAALAKQLAK